MALITWSGSGDFSNEDNWTPKGKPTAGDIAKIDSGSVTGSGDIGQLRFNGSVTLDSVSLTVIGTQSGTPANGKVGVEVNGSVTMDGGSITCLPGVDIDVGNSQTGSGTGTFTVT